MTTTTSSLPTAALTPANEAEISSIGATSTSSGTGSNNVNANTFLQLLVAQLQYQNPDNPTNPSTFLSQTAMFQEVEQLQTLTTDVSSLATAQASTSAASMLGQNVTATDSNGDTLTGTVSAVNFGGTNGPELTVGGEQIPLSSVTSMQSPSSTTSTASSAPTST